MLANLMKNAQPKKEAEKPPPTPDISSLLGLLGMSSSAEKSKEESSASRIFGTKEEMKKRIALLNSVKPYLSEERSERLDSVIRLLRLTELGELGKLLAKI